jgi:sugar phosphate isomerase/epimerase
MVETASRMTFARSVSLPVSRQGSDRTSDRSSGPIVGTTSYGFRYLLLDERRAPPLADILRQTRDLGLEALQICENARPLALSDDAWRDLIHLGEDIGLALHVGCMTLDQDTLARYVERAAAIPGTTMLRLVMEDETGEAPSAARIAAFLDAATVRARDAGLTLVIENHFHIACRTLAEAAEPYAEHAVAFCVDSANSLRNWESAEQVFDTLDHRAAFYHLKDYQVRGSNVGFEVTGAPLGTGLLDLQSCLRRMRARHAVPLIFLENWVPASGDRAADVAADVAWLTRSLAGLRRALDGERGDRDDRGGAGGDADAGGGIGAGAETETETETDA